MYRNFKTFNHAKFRNDIYNENWEFLDSGLDPNRMWTEWKTKFLQIVDKHVPIRIKRVRSKNCPWITAGLKERMHNCDTLKIKAIKSNDPKLANDVPLSNNNDYCHREYVKGINNRFEFRPTDSGQVLKLLNKLNKSKVAGLNKLSSQLIHECADLISPCINYF